MKHPYRWMRPLLALLPVFAALSADAQAWRPFRPGLIYAFGTPGSSSAYMLRLDSAYQTAGGDSAWTFGRVMKLSNGGEQSVNPYGLYRKSRNNLFGARLTWQRSPAAFILENLAEGSFQTAVALQLRPQAAVGSTWTASTAPALTATLTSRSLQTVGGQADSVAVITLSSGQVVRLSRRYGLLEAPQWLGTASATAQWTQTRLPMTLAQSPYNPVMLFTQQPGDEMGYEVNPFTISYFPDSRSHILRRILTRRQTADSLLFTFLEQTRTETFATPTGGTPGTFTGPVQVKQWAFSLRTGKSLQYPTLPLLTGEYKLARTSAQGPYIVGRGIVGNSTAIGCGPSGQYLSFIQVYPAFNAPMAQYSTGIDTGWQQWFSLALGMGDVFTSDGQALIYYRRSVGSPLTCGAPLSFTGLLPTRAAQAAAVANLAPNPAADRVTLTLTAPARPGTRLVLRDALGRTVWRAPVPTGQTEAGVPLAGQPAGLYLLQVERPEAAPVTLRLTKE